MTVDIVMFWTVAGILMFLLLRWGLGRPPQ
jgi:hypothetical protein